MLNPTDYHYVYEQDDGTYVVIIPLDSEEALRFGPYSTAILAALAADPVLIDMHGEEHGDLNFQAVSNA